MKYLVYFMNVILVVLIPVAFIMTPVKQEKEKSYVIKTNALVKKIESRVFVSYSDNISAKEKDEEETVLEEPEDTQLEEEKKTLSAKKEKMSSTIDSKKSEPIVTVEEEAPKNEIITGKLSGYGPDCYGCSGTLASGKYVGNGDIYYNDPTYGKVRIVAGDRKYSLGTIIRIKNSKVGNDILAIVLDRGGAIGIGKTYLFDLLFASQQEALKYEVSYNVNFEILRNGY